MLPLVMVVVTNISYAYYTLYLQLLTKHSVVQVEGGVSVLRLFAQQSHSSDTRGKTYRGYAQT